MLGGEGWPPGGAGGGQQVRSARSKLQAETSGGGCPGHHRACLVVGGNRASKGPGQAPGRAGAAGPSPTPPLGWRRPQMFCWPHTPGQALPPAAAVIRDRRLAGPWSQGSWSYCPWQAVRCARQWAHWDSGASAGRTRRPLPEPWLGNSFPRSPVCLPLSLS